MKKEGLYVFHQNYVSNPYILVFILLFIIWAVLCFWVYYSFGENWLIFTVVVGFFLRYFIRVRLEIDTNSKQYRSVLNLFGIAIGKWISLEELSHVQIGGIIEYKKKENATTDNYQQTKKIQVRLIFRTKTLVVWEGNDKEEAKEAGIFLGKNLNLKILDATQREFKWLDD